MSGPPTRRRTDGLRNALGLGSTSRELFVVVCAVFVWIFKKIKSVSAHARTTTQRSRQEVRAWVGWHPKDAE